MALPAKPFTPRTLADHWECSEQHIRDLIKGGKLRSFRIGGLIRISVCEVERVESGSDDAEAGSMPSGQIQKRGHSAGRSAPKVVQVPNAR